MARPKILIVDDEIIIARELEVRLKSLGYDVPGIASSGPEAIRLAIETQPNLILMDIVLKGEMDGIEAATEIRRRYQVPIIYVTAYTDTKTLERAKQTQPYGYIVKPFSERELNANIEMAIYKHRVESRLRRVERWFVAAIDEIGDAVIAADRDGLITLFNPAAEAITQWSKEEAIGRRLDDIFRLTYRTNGEPFSLEGISEGPVICLADETVLIDKSEQSIPIDNTTSCIRDEQDRLTGTVSVFRDPTGQRHGAIVTLNTDVALAAAQAVTLRGMLQLCAESMARNLNAAFARIWTLDTTGKILLLQASAGISTHLDGPDSRISVGKGAIGTIAQERKPHLTNDVLHDPLINDPEWAERERIISFAGYPLLIDDRLVGVMVMYGRRTLSEGVVEALESVAHAIAVGIERKRLEEQLRQAQKMEAIGQLAGGIAHDFNNLLTIISGYSQILMKRNNLDEDTRGLVKQISSAGDRAASLTRQLLAFSRKQVLEPKVLNINSLVSDIEKMLQRLIGEGVSLATVLDPELAHVTADSGQLEQVIMNLAVNSADAMPDGGRLTIETSNVELDETFTRTQPTLEPGDYVMLAVSDNGCGMTPDVQAHIFEPFFTTKGPGKGTGLGLATVYGIVRQSSGHIGVYSEPELGTTIKIYLPSTKKKGALDTSQLSSHSMPNGSETILLVEDENAVRALARYILQECGYTVLDAFDGTDALEVAEGYKESIELIVTDVVLPELGGRLVVERLTASRPDIKVLYMSGYTDDAVVRHGVLQAETAFIQKPFTPSTLANKVREVLDQPSPSPDSNG